MPNQHTVEQRKTEFLPTVLQTGPQRRLVVPPLSPDFPKEGSSPGQLFPPLRQSSKRCGMKICGFVVKVLTNRSLETGYEGTIFTFFLLEANRYIFQGLLFK